MSSSIDSNTRGFSLPGFGGGGGGGVLGFDIKDYFSRIGGIFDVDFPDGKGVWDELRADDFNLGSLREEYHEAVEWYVGTLIQDYKDWVSISMPHELWDKIDDFYARNTLGAYFVTSAGLAWLFGESATKFTMPWPISLENGANWVGNLNLWRGTWGAIGPTVGGYATLAAIAPITAMNMMLTLPYFLGNITLHLAELSLKMTYATIKASFDHAKRIGDATWDELQDTFSQIGDNLKEAFSA